MALSKLTLEVISTFNLDACENDELYAFSIDAYYCPYTIAHTMFGNDREESGVAVRQLGNYAQERIKARECRLRGAISEAVKHDAKCETIYNALPEFAKW